LQNSHRQTRFNKSRLALDHKFDSIRQQFARKATRRDNKLSTAERPRTQTIDRNTRVDQGSSNRNGTLP